MFDGDKCIGGIQSEAEIRIEIPGLQKSTILVQGTKKVFQMGQSLLAAEKSSGTIILTPSSKGKKPLP